NNLLHGAAPFGRCGRGSTSVSVLEKKCNCERGRTRINTIAITTARAIAALMIWDGYWARSLENDAAADCTRIRRGREMSNQSLKMRSASAAAAALTLPSWRGSTEPAPVV